VGAAHPAALTFRNGGSAVTTLAAHRLMSIRDSALVRDAIHHDISRCDRPGGQVQALINLQSSADDVDPEMDFSVGAVHFHRIRTSTDDLRQGVEDTGSNCQQRASRA
jgi:hypothetical protein